MPRIKNISPIGAIDVPLLRRTLEADEQIDVTEDQARRLLAQPDVYGPVDKQAKTIAADLAAEQEPAEDEVPGDEEQDAGAAAGGAGEAGEGQ